MRLITTPDGTPLNLTYWGNPTGAPRGQTCLLIHGFGDGGYIWSTFAPEIAERFKTVAIDLRGHGDSGWDRSGCYEMQTYVADVIHAIEMLDAERVVLMGHSMGAEIALRSAAACLDRLAGLVIVDFGPCLNPDGSRRVHADVRAACQTYRSVDDFTRLLAERLPLSRPAILRTLASAALRPVGNCSFRLKIDPAITQHDDGEGPAPPTSNDDAIWQLLKDMLVPVLVVRGTGSAVLPQYAVERMVNVLQNGESRSVPFAGHAVMTDNPEGFAEAVRSFLLGLV